VEGLRVLELKAEEGDKVTRGQVLAVLVHDTLDAQIAQNDAALARTGAAIAQAKSQIAQAEAKLEEAKAAFDRARPLTKSGAMSESVFDQREAAAKTAQAQLVSTRDGLKVAEAEKAQVEAQRRELLWKRGNTEVKSPADGVVSRRTARVGANASGAGEPMFRIIARGEIELDAEVSEADIGRLAEGLAAAVWVAGGARAEGRVRLVSPEIDKATRMGRARIFLGTNPALRIGGFARAQIETASSRGIAVPAAAVLYGADGAYVQLVKDGRILSRRVTTGLASGGLVEIRQGVEEGDTVVARSGTFLREGDAVRPVLQNGTKVSELN
jgi:RND family efflux transporter MFP subunit